MSRSASNGTVTVAGYIAEAGGIVTGINYAVSNSATGSSGGSGSLGSTSCTRSASEFTTLLGHVHRAGNNFGHGCYVRGGNDRYVVFKDCVSSAVEHGGNFEQPRDAPDAIGDADFAGKAHGGNNIDYDTQGNQIVDCCGGTLGALIQNSSNTQYILSCNHVLARSDQAAVGEMIVQPGLIDNNCTPNGVGSGTTPVGVLTTWLPLSSASTNVDAAIAAVNSGAVSPTGAILELGTPGAGGVLAAAPPGISSTSGKGENGSIGMSVAKSGRTTGLTCANISAVNLSVQVSYFKNCEETEPYLTKTYTNQIAIEANQFSDAGDSGSLVVDTADAEPVGLFFAGGETNTGVGEGIANPAPTVLAELGIVQEWERPTVCRHNGSPGELPELRQRYSNCRLRASTLGGAQSQLAQQALTKARGLVNPSAGILGVAAGKSSDHAGQAAVILYVDQNMNVTAPQMVNGVRTEVIPTTAQAIAVGAVPTVAAETNALPPLASAVLNQAIAQKEQVAQSLMKQNPAFFGVGVGQSLDNPKEGGLMVRFHASIGARAGSLLLCFRLSIKRAPHPVCDYESAACDAVVPGRANPAAESLHGACGDAYIQ